MMKNVPCIETYGLSNIKAVAAPFSILQEPLFAYYSRAQLFIDWSMANDTGVLLISFRDPKVFTHQITSVLASSLMFLCLGSMTSTK